MDSQSFVNLRTHGLTIYRFVYFALEITHFDDIKQFKWWKWIFLNPQIIIRMHVYHLLIQIHIGQQPTNGHTLQDRIKIHPWHRVKLNCLLLVTYGYIYHEWYVHAQIKHNYVSFSENILDHQDSIKKNGKTLLGKLDITAKPQAWCATQECAKWTWCSPWPSRHITNDVTPVDMIKKILLHQFCVKNDFWAYYCNQLLKTNDCSYVTNCS